MDDTNIFMTLTPYDEWGLTIDSFTLPHNIARYVKPSPVSRETTPSGSGHDDTPANELEYFHRIQLRFDQETRVKGRVTFGSDPGQCDVLLVSRRPRFYISFDNEQRPAIWDESNNGFTVSYDGQAKDDLRSQFKWILFSKYRTIRVTIPLRNNRKLAFNVHLPRHYKKHSIEYENNVKRFMAGAPPPHEVAFHNLALRSPGTSFAPSESLSPSKRPIYLKSKVLGKGAFGQVRKLVDASTGHEYAGKEFFQDQGWEKEIEIMKNLRHDHIVNFHDFTRSPNPLLVMEYVPLRSLQTQHDISAITDDEMMVVFNQALEGLSYLHHQNITHRDLKPENILMRSRTPVDIILADFGLAQNRERLKTFCGTPMYAAPEIFNDRPYTCAVDIWSLAVVVMDFVYGLPKHPEIGHQNPKGEVQFWGKTWCRYVMKKAEDWDSDRLIDFLTKYMLKLEPLERLSAAECLRTASEIGLFHNPLQTGNLTPRAEPVRHTGDVDTDDASTIREPSADTSARDQGCASRSRGPSPPFIAQHGRLEHWRRRVETYEEGEDAPSASVIEYNNRAPKRRRTTNDFDLDLGIPGSFDKDHPSQRPRFGSKKTLLDEADDSARRVISINLSVHSDRVSGILLVPQPLERHGQFVVQFVEKHQAILRLTDARVNFTADTSTTGPWIDISTARELCAAASLGQWFRPLLAFGEAQEPQEAQISSKMPDTLQRKDIATDFGQHNEFSEFGELSHNKTRQKDKFKLLNCDKDIVAVRQHDWSVNITHIFKASPAHNGYSRFLSKFKQKIPCLEVVRGDPQIAGSYAHISLAVNLSHLLGLTSIARALVKLAYNPGGQNEEVFGDNLPRLDQEPLPAAQPESVPTEAGAAIDLDCGDNFNADINFSEVDRLLQMSRPSFRFMTPSQPSC